MEALLFIYDILRDFEKFKRMKMEGIWKILTTLQSIMFKVIFEHHFVFIFSLFIQSVGQ